MSHFAEAGWQIHAVTTPGKTIDFDLPAGAATYPLSLTDELAINQMLNQLPQLDALLLLAGGYEGNGLQETDWTSVQRMIDTNFRTAFHLAKSAAIKMSIQPDGGRIIMVGARPAINPDHGQHAVAYALSKAMLMHFAQLLNAAFSTSHVLTHVIVPSTLDTPANRKAMPDADPSLWVPLLDVAETMHWLCTDVAKTYRNEVLHLYGGA